MSLVRPISGLLAGLILPFVGALPAAGTMPDFECVRLRGAGTSAFGMVAGDWDGDGRVDLAVSYARSNLVEIFLNRGARRFESVQTIADVGDLPRGLTAGDLDADGDLDIVVVAADSSSARILRGDGRARFVAEQRRRAGVAPMQPAIADLDGDGHADIVVVNESNVSFLPRGQVSVFFAGGSMPLGEKEQLLAGHHPSAVVILPIDGDRRPDLAVVNWDSADYTLFLNQGKREFRRVDGPTTGGGPAYSLYAGDLNGDGHVDLAATDLGARIHVRLGTGDARFGEVRSYRVGSSPRWLTAADIDDDGKPDLVSADTGSDRVSILRGVGDGGFAPAMAVLVGDAPRTVITADLDGDGRADLATANLRSSDVTVLYSVRSGGRRCVPVPGRNAARP